MNPGDWAGLLSGTDIGALERQYAAAFTPPRGVVYLGGRRFGSRYIVSRNGSGGKRREGASLTLLLQAVSDYYSRLRPRSTINPPASNVSAAPAEAGSISGAAVGGGGGPIPGGGGGPIPGGGGGSIPGGTRAKLVLTIAVPARLISIRPAISVLRIAFIPLRHWSIKKNMPA
jgi:hypothetical protein